MNRVIPSMKETIYHPDMRDTSFGYTEKSPRLSHFTVEHGELLEFSPNPVINKLIEAGWEIHPTFSQFYMAIPRTALTLGMPFVFEERHEFEIRVDGLFFLRFRFEKPDSVFLTLFRVEKEKQGRGLGRVWFPRVTDALFRAGIKYMWGKVQPPFYSARWEMDVPRLIAWYERQGFLNCGDERVWKFSPYRVADTARTGDTVTASESETAAVLQS